MLSVSNPSNPLNPSPNPYNAIVVGLGAMGSATLCHLALRGSRVLGIEQFERGHRLGSSHGDTRIIRETYFEHPLYVPLVQRAHALWRELEEHSGQQLMTITGGLMIGPPEGVVVTGTLRSARTHDLPHEVLTPDEVHERFPAFELAEHLSAVWDPRAGILAADACNAAHLDVAERNGAETRFNERMTEWSADGDGVRVATERGEYLAGKLVITAGGWTNHMLRDLELPLAVERQVAFWLEPGRSDESYDLPNFPIYAHEYMHGEICYGFPRLEKGVKASIMHSGALYDSPDFVDRTTSELEAEPLRQALAPVLPELSRARVLDREVCLFTNTPDHDFVIDWHPQYPQVLISSPCSGHGFKFASAIGELQADMVLENRTEFDLAPFRLGRFEPGS